MGLPDIFIMDRVFWSGFVYSRFAESGRIRRFVPFVASKKADAFVRVSFTAFRWPSLGTRTATRMNVNDSGIRRRMTRALAVFTKRHFASPA